MPPRSVVLPVAVLIVVLVAGPGLGVPGAAAQSDGAATTDTPGGNATPSGTPTATPARPLPASNLTFVAAVEADGDATWSVRVEFPIRGVNDSLAFEDTAERFREGEYDLGLDGFVEVVSRVDRRTNRSMDLVDVNRTAGREDGRGVLTLSFRWTNFARSEGDRLVVEDAFRTGAGTWLRPLDENQALVVAPPPGYSIVEAPTVEDRTARWDGPYDFTGRLPRVVFDGAPTTSPTPTPTPTATPTPTDPAPGGTPTSTPGAGTSSGLPWTMLLVVVAVLAGAGVAAIFYANQDEDADGGVPGGSSGADGPSGASGTDGADPATAEASATDAAGSDATGPDTATASGETPAGGASAGAAGAAGASGADDAAAAGSGAGAEGDDGDEDDGVAVELLSDEERVEYLLDSNGGRMKQASIVKETGWSNAKVSQLLSAMEEDGRIDKLRIGRENLISFPDEDVADLDSE